MYCPRDASSVGSLANEMVCAVVLLAGSHRPGLASGCSELLPTRISCGLLAEGRREWLGWWCVLVC